jgi:hypothetical protein
MMPKNSEKNGPGQEMSCLTADYGRLRGMQRNLLRSTGEKREKLQAEFAALLEKSHAGLAQRQASLPKPEFQADLPVNERRAEIAALIKKHQVVIVCGETGSGKTTQLPKICLELGRGGSGLIGHTQPRRLAARSVANATGTGVEDAGWYRRRRKNPLPGPVDRRQLGQADDRRHPARRIAVRPLPEAPTTRSSSTKRMSAA